jgi:hypothetical protein
MGWAMIPSTMTTAIPELPGWFAMLGNPRRRQPLAAIDRKVPVVNTQSRNLKERLIRKGRAVVFHMFSLFYIINEEHYFRILFAYSHENIYLLHFVDLVYIGGMISNGTKSMQIGV